MTAIIKNEGDINAGLVALQRLDNRLADVAEKAGAVPLRLRSPGVAGLANIVVAQMISRAAADSVWARLEAAVGGAVNAATLNALSLEELRAAGLSAAKAHTLLRISDAALTGDLDLDGVCELSQKDAVAQLTAVKGIGQWTAEVYLMFCAGHADIFPVGDVALQNAVGHAFALEERPKGKQLTAIAENWAPWRSVAARLFWAYYAVAMRRDVLPI